MLILEIKNKMPLFQQQPSAPIGERNETTQQNQIPFYQQGEELGKEMLNTGKLIEKIRLQLLGYVETADGWKKIGEALMNEKGASAIITMLHAHVGKEVFLTKITDYDKVRIVRDLWSTLIVLILKNREEWELSHDTGKWRIIREIVINQAYFALCRGVNGVEKGFFGDVYQNRTVQTSNNQQQFKKGFLGG